MQCWGFSYFSQDEIGSQRRLSHLYHVLCWVEAKCDTGIKSTSFAYFPLTGQIQINQSRVKLCSPGFPSGLSQYGTWGKSTWFPPNLSQKPNSMSVPLENHENSIMSKKVQKQKYKKSTKHSSDQARMRVGDVTDITLKPY